MDETPYPVRQWLPFLQNNEVMFHVLTSIMSHPEEQLTRVEIDYMLTYEGSGRTTDDVERILTQLLEDGFVTTYETDDYTFYALTEPCKQFFVDWGQYKAKQTLQQVMDNVKRPPAVEDAYTAPRPSHSPTETKYTQHSTHESEAWQDALNETYHILTLSVVRLSEEVFYCLLTHDDTPVAFDVLTLSGYADTVLSFNIGEVTTREYRERKKDSVSTDAYDIGVTRDEHGVTLAPLRDGGALYEIIDRSVYLPTRPAVDADYA